MSMDCVPAVEQLQEVQMVVPVSGCRPGDQALLSWWVVGERRPGSGYSRRSNWPWSARTTVESDIRSAQTANGRTNPMGASTRAAMGTAERLDRKNSD